MPPCVEKLDLKFSLHRMPSVQHQAGLGALTLLLQTIDDAPEHHLAEYSLDLTLTPASLTSLFTYLYGGTEVTRTTGARPQGPHETILVEEGYGQTSTQYVTKERRPKGEWLTKLGYSEAHITAWRNGIWSHLRDRSRSREIYDAPPVDLAEDLWKALVKSQEGKPATVPISSALMIGTRAANAEGVPFEDTPEHVLLLHFQHAMARAVPIVSVDRKLTYHGIAWTVPVPLSLSTFQPTLSDLPERVTSAQEAALALLSTNPNMGVFCAHLDKQGHNVNVRDTACLHPTSPLLEPYRDVIAPTTNLKLRSLLMRNLTRGWPLHKDVHDLPELVDAEAEYLPYRDCHQLAKKLQPASYQSLKDHALSQLEQAATRRFPHLTREEYQQGRGYPERRERFRESWLSCARRLLSQVRTARTRKLMENLIPNLQADWQEQRDTLALALASCANIVRGDSP